MWFVSQKNVCDVFFSVYRMYFYEPDKLSYVNSISESFQLFKAIFYTKK